MKDVDTDAARGLLGFPDKEAANWVGVRRCQVVVDAERARFWGSVGWRQWIVRHACIMSWFGTGVYAVACIDSLGWICQWFGAVVV